MTSHQQCLNVYLTVAFEENIQFEKNYTEKFNFPKANLIGLAVSQIDWVELKNVKNVDSVCDHFYSTL